MILKLIFILITFLIEFIYSIPNPTSNYANKLILKEPDIYILYWNYTDSDILFEVHVKTKGWISFGLSPNGDMFNSDIIITWINSNGTVHFTDRNIKSTRNRNIDKEQNWFSLLTINKDNYIISKFTRKIKICDTNNEDIDIESGTPFVIFAWGESFSNNDADYHGSNRGSKTVPLITTLNTKVNINMNEVEITDFRVNVIYFLYFIFFNILLINIKNKNKKATIEPMPTAYYCQMFKLPSDWAKEKRHLIRVLYNFFIYRLFLNN